MNPIQDLASALIGNHKAVAEENERLRQISVQLCGSNECRIRNRCTSASPGYCRSLVAMGLDYEAWDTVMSNIGDQRERAENAEQKLAAAMVENEQLRGLLSAAQGDRKCQR